MPARVHLKAPRKVTETDISREIRKALEKLGIPVWRMNSGKMRVRGGFVQLNPAGTADILAAPSIFNDCEYCGGLPGILDEFTPVFLWIEVKKPGGTQSREQIEFSVRMRNRSHIYLLVESLDEVLAWLKEYEAR